MAVDTAPKPKYEFGITSDLHKYGTTEDGEEYFAELYYIVARETNGRQFAYRDCFPGCKIMENSPEDGDGIDYYFADIREEAQQEAEKLVNQFIAANPTELDPADWHAKSPVYGSSAYDESELVAWERDHDGYGPGY